MEEDNQLLHLLPVRVEEVLEEVGDGLVGDVAAHHDVAHPLILEGSSVLGSVAEQLNDLGDGGGEHGEADREEEHLEASSQDGLAVDISVAWECYQSQLLVTILLCVVISPTVDMVTIMK